MHSVQASHRTGHPEYCPENAWLIGSAEDSQVPGLTITDESVGVDVTCPVLRVILVTDDGQQKGQRNSDREAQEKRNQGDCGDLGLQALIAFHEP